MNDIETTDWYQSLVDDIRSMAVEGIYNIRREKIFLYHGIGERLVNDQDYQRYSHGNGKILSRVSENTNVSERDLYRSIQFYTLYPNLDTLPDGKNISWHKIVNFLLPAGEPVDELPPTTSKQRVGQVMSSVRRFLNKYPDDRDALVRAFWEIIGGEWK